MRAIGLCKRGLNGDGMKESREFGEEVELMPWIDATGGSKETRRIFAIVLED